MRGDICDKLLCDVIDDGCEMRMVGVGCVREVEERRRTDMELTKEEKMNSTKGRRKPRVTTPESNDSS